MNKYHNTKVKIFGKIFDSKKEAEYYLLLLDKKRRGKIKDFKLQVPFVLQDEFRFENKRILPITYIADFVITENDGSTSVVDTKGFKTEIYKLKKKMFIKRYNKKIIEV